MLPWFEARKKEQPAGRRRSMSPLDPDKLERFGRYEVHLDRKLERQAAIAS